MSISFTPCRFSAGAYEACSDRYLNLANRNAGWVLDALGLPHEPTGEIECTKLANLCTAWLRANLGERSPEIETVVTVGIAGATMIDCGLREGYLNERIQQLGRLAREAAAIGATHITWS